MIPGGLLNIYNSVGFLVMSSLLAPDGAGTFRGGYRLDYQPVCRDDLGAPRDRLVVFNNPSFLFGHALNMGLNVLGAYVHSSRLQYLEFLVLSFGGGGRPFSPLKIENINIFLKKRGV